LSERGNTGRIKIKSVKNLVNKEGAKNFVDLVTSNGKKNFLKEKQSNFHKNSLKGLGIVDKNAKTINLKNLGSKKGQDDTISGKTGFPAISEEKEYTTHTIQDEDQSVNKTSHASL
jgi:hypothetical protein